MGAKATFNELTKIITIIEAPDGDDEVYIDFGIDLYSDGKEDWVSNENLRKFAFPISAVGGNPLPGSKELGTTFFLASDWKIKPYEADHRLTVNGNAYSDDGTDMFVDPDGVFTIRIMQVVSSLVDSTVQQLSDIEYASFQNAVWYDVDSIYTIEHDKAGNRQYPVNNIPDAVEISGIRGFSTIQLLSNVTFTTGDSLINFVILGMSRVLTNVVIEDGAECDNIRIKDCNVSGILDGGTMLEYCDVSDLYYFNGGLYNCGLGGLISLNGGGKAVIADCKTIDQDNPPIIDMGGSGQSLAIPNYSGIVTFKNLTSDTEEIGVGLDAGYVILDSTISAGTIILSGVGLHLDNSTGTASVNTEGLLNTNTIANSVGLSYTDRIYIDVLNGSSGTDAPLGTEKYPVDNLPDALTIAAREQKSIFDVHGALVITTSQDVSGITILAARSLGNSVVVNSGAITDGTYFENLTVSGVMNGSVRYTTCVVGAITNFDGGAKNCLIIGDIHFTGVNNNYLTECDTYVTSSSYISLYLNNASLNIIRGRGRWGIIDKLIANVTAIDLVSGFVYVDITCDVGEIHVGGIGAVEDNSDDGCIVKQGAINNEYIANAVWDVDLTDHNIPESTGSAANDISYTDKFIFINTELGVNGNGKSHSPFNNVSDAVDFAELVGWRKLIALSDITLERIMKNFTIEGIGLPTIDINGQDVDKSVFLTLKLTGQQVGSITAREVVLLPGISDLDGIYKECAVVAGGTYNIVEGGSVSLTTISVFPSGVTPIAPIFDLGAATTTSIFSLRKYSGSAKIINVNTSSKLASLEFDGGKVIIDSSCSAGNIRIINLLDTSIIDNNTGSEVTLINIFPSVDTIWNSLITEYTIDGSFGKELATKDDLTGGITVTAETDPIVKLAAILSL